MIAPPAILVESMTWTDAGLTFLVEGSPGQAVRVAFSDDLQAWNELATTELGDTPWEVLDGEAPRDAARYYRVETGAKP